MPGSFKEFFDKAKLEVEYWAELAVLDFSCELETQMKTAQVTRAELAKRIGTSPAYVTKALNGKSNFTLRSMAAMAHALGKRLAISMVDVQASAIEAPSDWISAANITPDVGRFILLRTRHTQEINSVNNAVNERFTEFAEAA